MGTNYFLLKSGEFAYNKSYSNGYPVGVVRRLKRYDSGILSPLYICFDMSSSEVDELYAEHFFDSQWFIDEINQIAKEGARNHGLLNVGVGEFFDLEFVLPPLPEQQKIAAILSSVDDVIEKTRAQIDKLKDLKTGMMQELLTKGIGSDGVPHTEFKDSPVGRVPVSWEIVRLGDVSKVQGGFAFKSADATDNGCRWLKIANVGRGTVVWGEKSFLPNEFLSEYSDFALKEADIVVALTRPVISGELKVAQLMKSDAPSLLNQRVARVIPKLSRVSREYLFTLLSWRKVANDIEQAIFGTDPPNVSTKQIESLCYPLPPREEQDLIASSLGAVSNRIRTLSNKLDQLRGTKEALMQDLLTGKVRVNVDQKESAVA
ncbi:restriction endonuclease subunit S [Marinobacter nauticus]|uniref:Restriction modification system DNA specificity domain n=1 Tax=Marinobacter nauticus (strain ATCC 700491 / DSM 11845 / VT8) TaxID=351348 RepID=A1U398_MARN8|nr:restriction endonuclease subunit S [Marinobacter nauticus]ABM19467.1 restriction modification system DNA specificity domain [Marinobacter nauticus VT8]